MVSSLEPRILTIRLFPREAHHRPASSWSCPDADCLIPTVKEITSSTVENCAIRVSRLPKCQRCSPTRLTQETHKGWTFPNGNSLTDAKIRDTPISSAVLNRHKICMTSSHIRSFP